MLKAVDCRKAFGRQNVLRGIHFEVSENNIHGFIGINGVGKSTFIKCLFQFLKLDYGVIFIDGKPIEADPHYRRRLGYLPEVFTPPLDLTCGEFLKYCHALIRNHTPSPEEIRNILSRTGLADQESVITRKLSKGMRQRLGIAQALIHAPRLLILDEPFSGLDPIGRADLKNLFRTLHADGLTLFFSSHNLNEIQDLCTHVTILHEGRIHADGLITDILNQANTPTLEKAFLKLTGTSLQEP